LLLLVAVASMAIACDLRSEGLGPQVSESSRDGSGRDGAGVSAGDARSDRTGTNIDPVPRDGPPGRADGGADRPSPTSDVAPGRDLPPPTTPPVDGPPVALPPDAPPPPPPDTPSGAQVLLLVGDTTLSAGDRALSNRLAGLGFRVQAKLVDTDAQATEAAAMAPGFQLVVLSSSLRQGTGLPVQFRPLAVPLLCSKVEFSDRLGMSIPGESAVASGETELQIRRPEHPMAAGRRGVIPVTTQERPFGLVEPVSDGLVIATIAEEPDEALIFALEKGASDRFGTVGARRVGWFAQESTYLSLNDAGWALFDAAIRWVTAAP
jgi:hypothetical protein